MLSANFLFCRYISNATGLNALHVASLYGEVDAIRVLLTHMPAQMKANEPQNLNLALSKVKNISIFSEIIAPETRQKSLQNNRLPKLIAKFYQL